MAELDPPAERECKRCGRRDVWDSDAVNWQISTEAPDGDHFCIHEWDINGTYKPVQE